MIEPTVHTTMFGNAFLTSGGVVDVVLPVHEVVLPPVAHVLELAVQSGGDVEDVDLVLDQLDEPERLGEVHAVGMDLVGRDAVFDDEVLAAELRGLRPAPRWRSGLCSRESRRTRRCACCRGGWRTGRSGSRGRRGSCTSSCRPACSGRRQRRTSRRSPGSWRDPSRWWTSISRPCCFARHSSWDGMIDEGL